jgi:catalase (peroxidase I)
MLRQLALGSLLLAVVVSGHYFDSVANRADAIDKISKLNIGNGGLIGGCGNRARRFIRFAWHDASTTDVYACTGGLDASIIFEGLFAANAPRGVHTQFVNDINNLHANTCGTAQTSCFADIIALAAIEAVKACGGPAIEFAWGRQDTNVANTQFLTPGQAETLAQAEAKFYRMGITSEDEILALVAGGHTVARHAIPNLRNPPNQPGPALGFNLTAPCAVTIDNCPNPGPCTLPFDSTPTKFDAQYFKDVLDYLNHGTQCPVGQDFIVIPVEEEMYQTNPYHAKANQWKNEDKKRQSLQDEHRDDITGNDVNNSEGDNEPGWIANSFRDTFRRSFEYLLNWKLTTCTPSNH